MISYTCTYKYNWLVRKFNNNDKRQAIISTCKNSNGEI